eukprot:m.180866 g.180866  ORF g.180866 m.180866 type:complete len:124 (+) comp13579_c0_seq16:776-1147(+)
MHLFLLCIQTIHNPPFVSLSGLSKLVKQEEEMLSTSTTAKSTSKENSDGLLVLNANAAEFVPSFASKPVEKEIPDEFKDFALDFDDADEELLEVEAEMNAFANGLLSDTSGMFDGARETLFGE